MNNDIAALHHKMQTDLQFFCLNAPVRIKDVKGGLVPLQFNRAQIHLHTEIERQKRETGKVRIIAMKGRQEGISTYVAARFYFLGTHLPGKSVFILSHLSSTTKKLFEMVKRIHKYIPEFIRAKEGQFNGYGMSFPELESDYTVGTAGSDDSGRGGTIQYFHGSEVAYWANTEEIQTGILQSISDEAGTEIILESTANGPIGLFYDMAMNAIKGIGDYRLVFMPWWWEPRYEREIGPDFTPTEEEAKYGIMYFPEIPLRSRLRKLAWMRNKRIELKRDWLFKREYPATPMEAFQSAGKGLVAPDLVSAARKSTLVDDFSPAILGVDPARDGDRTALVLRRGRVVSRYETFEKMRPMMLAGIVADWIKRENIQMVFMDVAEGSGAVDRLHELGFKNVRAVAFGSGASNPLVYTNKRSEMIIQAGEWFANEGGVRIPDDDSFHADIAAMPEYRSGSDQRKSMPPKSEIKKTLGRSPDIFDALSLTFAFPVCTIDREPPRRISVTRKSGAGLSSLEAIRKAYGGDR